MANIKFILRGRGKTKSLHVRFYKGRDLDLQSTTGLLVRADKWDDGNSKYRMGKNHPNGLINQNRIDKLRTHIIDLYNDAHAKGIVMDKQWFSSGVSQYFHQAIEKFTLPQDLTGFSKWWLENKSDSWRTGKGKTMDARLRKQYKSASDLWNVFQGTNNYHISGIGSSLISEFGDFLELNRGYSAITAKRIIGRIRFFISRAESQGLEVNAEYKDRIYIGSGQEPLKPYLNEEEICSIFNLDLSHDDKLDNIRDLMILAVHSGLRISDFNNNLDVDNIANGYINLKTKKTGVWVRIPVHYQVAEVLNKRHGFLPRRYNDSYFNTEIKTLCMLAEIDEVIPGKKYIGEKKRSIYGNFMKWELITAHTLRRSFCSNLYGNVPNHVLTDLGGWTNERTMINYVKRTKAESAEVLKSYWNKKYNI